MKKICEKRERKMKIGIDIDNVISNFNEKLLKVSI